MTDDNLAWSGLPERVLHALAARIHARAVIIRIPLAAAGGASDWMIAHWPAQMQSLVPAACNHTTPFPATWSASGDATVERVCVDLTHSQLKNFPRAAAAMRAAKLTHYVRVAIPMPLDIAMECFLYFDNETATSADDETCTAAVLGWLPDFRAAMRNEARLLTPREMECLRLAYQGMTAAAVAHHLRCSDRTVNFHYANLMKKLGVSSKMAAALIAGWLGLI